MATPRQIALSAKLNAGQCQYPIWKSRKSTTAPWRIRSTTLPIAPPTMRPIAIAENRARHPPQPIDQPGDDDHGGEREQQRVERAAFLRTGVEQAKAHAAIEGQDQVEKRGDPVGVKPAPGEMGENRGFAQLIEDRDDDRRGEPRYQHCPALADRLKRRPARPPRRNGGRDRDGPPPGRPRAVRASSARSARPAPPSRGRRFRAHRAG